MNVGVLEVQLMANMARLSTDMKRAEQVVGDSMLKVEKHAHSAMSALNKIGMGVGLFAALEQVKQLSDRYTKLDAQLRLSTKTQEQYNAALSDVRRISTIAQADIGATTMLYTRMMNTMQGTAVTQKQLATVTETVSYGLKAYGATSAEAASATLQLSQAMGANRLGGEEFRAVMEAMPNVMKALADSMGVPLGELRALSIAGKITTAEMVKAFGDPAIAESFRKMALMSRTISGELTVMGNNTMQFVGSLLKTSGATDMAINAISQLGDVFKYALEQVKAISNLITILAVMYGGKFVASLVAARMATMAQNVELAKNAAVNVESALAAQFAAKANLAMGAQMALLTGNTRYATAARIEYIAATKAVAAAEATHAAASMTWMGKIKAFALANKAGLIGLALWGIYTVADSMGWVDKLSNKLGDFFNTQEAHIRKLRDLAGGGAAGDAMGRAIEEVGREEAMKASMDAQRKEMDRLGLKGDFSSQSSTSAVIAQLQKDMSKIREGGVSPNDERMLTNIQRSINILEKYRAELGKAASATGITKASFGSDWLAMIKGERTDAQKRFDKLAELKAMYEVELGKMSGSTSLADRLKLKKDYEAAIAEINKQKKEPRVAAVIGTSMMGKMAEEMTSKNIRDTSLMTNAQKVSDAWKEANDNIAAATLHGAGKKQIDAMIAARGTLSELERASAQARLADYDLETKKSYDRTKQITEDVATMERAQLQQRSTAGEIRAFDVAAVDLLIDKVQNQILLTDDLKHELQLRKELEALQAKKVIAGREPQFMDAFGSKDTEGGLKGMFTGMITGAITDWRDMIKSFGDSFKTKVIDFMAQRAADFLSNAMSNNPYVAVVVAAIAASGMLNKWEQSKQPANVSLTGGRGGVGGSVSTLWERDAGWFAQKEQEFRITGLTAKQNATYNSTLQSITHTMAVAGDALGYADAGTKAFNISLTTNGDITAAMANQIGAQLVPAIILFQREGENLQATAQRLTDTFKSTNDLITAIGVSSADAFGGYGLQSAAARESMVAASGGLAAFNSNAQNFITNFLTPAEKLAPAADAVARTFEKLGIVGISTNEQFAQLVKEQMALGNTDVVAQLLSVSGAFDSLTKAAMTANTQIDAILDKKLFSTLVDYLRATKLGASAGAAISAATLGLGTTTAAEQAGTAAYAAANADAIARAAAEQALTTTEMSNDPSLWQQLLAVIKELLNGLWILLRDAINNIWVAIRDFITSIPQLIVDAMVAVVQAIVDAIGNIGGNIIGGIGDGVGGIVPGIGDVVGGIGGVILDPIGSLFANGGAFTGGLYNTPTSFAFANGGGFSHGVMGEAGPEAVMPLQRDSNGRLGVSVNGGSGDVVGELRALREEVAMLRADNRSERAVVINTAQRTERILDKWDHIGMPEVQTS